MAVPYKLNYFEIETGIDSTSTFIHTGDLTATKVKKYLATSNDILLGDGTTTSLSGLQPTGNYITALTGEATATGPGSVAITLTNSAVIGKVLSGLSITGSTIASTDTILQAFGKVQNQINGKQATITLTTTGTSGAATFISNVLNIPQYTDAFVGTVTSVAALTLGTTGTDLSSTVANSTTTPVITLNVPTASAANRGALSAADWTTFNSKQDAITLTTTGSSGASTFISNTLNVPTYTLSGLGGVPTTRTITINGTSQDLSADRTYNVGTVTSVGLTMPAAFSIANSPVTTSGTIAVTGAGLASQYVRGDLALGDFPNTGGGGSSVSYYLNGSINQGTFVGNTYYEMNKTPVIGAGTDFTINANGYIAQFITDANDPASLLIPGGNWNVEMYFSASSSGGTPSFYVEVYKYDGTAFTLLGSSSATPEGITNGTAIDIYYTSVGIPETVLTITDRIAIRVYVTHSGRTITLHTEDNHLSEIVTTFSNGLTALNGLTKQVQFLAVGTSGTDFNISSSVDTHTFNIPTASATNRGALSFTDWTTFNGKQAALSGTGIVKSTAGVISYLTDPLPIANGGTGSATQNFVDLTTNQSIAGGKTFTSQGNFQAGLGVVNNSFGATSLSVSSNGLQSTGVLGNADYYGIKGIGNVAGVYGVITSATGSAINGEATTGYAGYFFNSSASNPTIYARNTNASGILLQLQGITGNTVFSVANSGALTLASTITNGTYTYTLPGATGTLALTSALTGYVPYTGATTDLVLGANNFSSKRVSVLKSSDGFGGFTSNYLFLETGTSSGSVGTDGVSINSKPSTRGLVINYDIATVNYSVELNASLLTNSRTLNFPDASGTLALTSALSSYLPLSGGTLTGALSGTSATFSGAGKFGGGTASYNLVSYNSSNGTSAAFGGTAYGLRIDNGGSFGNGGTTLHGVDNTFTASYQKLSLNGSSLEFMTDYGTKLTIANSGAATFSSSVTASSSIISTTAFGGTFTATDGTNQVRFGSYFNTIGSGNSYDGVIYTTHASSALYLMTGGSTTPKVTIASTGAATFSSSVAINGSTVSTEGLSVQYNQAKTYTTQTAVSRWHSNEGVGSQFKLNLFAIGNATGSSRVFKFQTSNEGVANDGILAFQSDGGNVGIGTTSPMTFGGFTNLTIRSSSATNQAAIFVLNSTETIRGSWYSNGSTQVNFGTATNHPLVFDTNDTERMRIAAGGAVTIVGSLSKGSGSFRIEHPLPLLSETHQLVHSFIEGPQADLIYRGKLTLVNGKAQANIDEVSTMTEGTFEVLCREVQCFTTNESGWDLVKGKVIGNIIYIESQNEKSTDEISWMVIGERKDKHMMDTDWTDENGKVIVEPLKPIEPEIEPEIIKPEIIEDLLKGEPIIPTDNNLE